ncbi:hypothetical protein pdam_00016443, partial [Pocillopora damicornis]
MKEMTPVKELMTAEFIKCRILIKQLDVRTRVRETLTKYPILANGYQQQQDYDTLQESCLERSKSPIHFLRLKVEEELERTLKFKKKVTGQVEQMLSNWRRFSIAEQEVTDTDVLNNFSKVFPTVCKKKKGAAQSHSSFVKLTSSEQKPNILVHDDKDSEDDNPNSPYSLMIGEHLYCQVTKRDHKLLCAPRSSIATT